MILAALINPRVRGGIAIVAAVAWTHWQAYQRGADSVRDQWDAQVDTIRQQAVAQAQADAQATVKVVTEYVDREKIVYRDRDVIRDRIVRLCDDAKRPAAQLPGSPGNPDAPAPGVAVDALADEIPQCVSIANQLDALQQFIRERW